MLRQSLIAAGPQQYVTRVAAPVLRQSVITGPSVTSANIISAPSVSGGIVSTGALGYGVGLGLRAGNLYDAQLLQSAYGNGAIVKVH